MKIALLYTGVILVPMISKIAKDAFPDAEIMNILDDSLIEECIKNDGVTKSVINKTVKLYQYACDSGADIIVDTCSSVGESVEIINRMINIPVYRIDSVMIKHAVEKYDRIGVLATLNSTIKPTCQLLEQEAKTQGRSIEIIDGLARGAYEKARIGDRAAHDKAIIDTARNMKENCDVFLLAQGSMALIKEELESKIGIPVLTSPEMFFIWLKEKTKGEKNE